MDQVRGGAMKFWLRACPKCGGDLKLEVEITGAYVQCLQCGLELNPGQQLDRMPAGPPEAVASGALRHHVA
ncbi:MAG: hypothetical protein J4N28_04445 [Chloroflexi bacterium]|nr:hypothetical protein [Chloroflexota bacterium]